ncbi:MAG: Crp/Fnr family transcriptional regulator [Vicinamibacteria bacterium]
MSREVDEALRANPLFGRLAAPDRAQVSQIATLRQYARGETIFSEGDASDSLYTIARGQVKVVKLLPAGREIILELLGAGDPLGAVAAYENRPFPASAVALDEVSCIVVRAAALFRLMETCPPITRGMFAGLSIRIMQLTQRMAEVAGSRVEARFAQLFLKLAERLGREQAGGTFIPLALSRQDLADLAGTTIETCIRVMSRWGKDEVVKTERDGFLVPDREALRSLVAG